MGYVIVRPGGVDGVEERIRELYAFNADCAARHRRGHRTLRSSRTNAARGVGDRAGVNFHACGLSAQPKHVAESIKHVKAPLLVQEAASTANHGLAIASDIPGKVEPRAEIVMVTVI